MDETGKADFAFIDFVKLEKGNWELFQGLLACLRGGYVPMQLILGVETDEDDYVFKSNPEKTYFYRRSRQSRTADSSELLSTFNNTTLN